MKLIAYFIAVLFLGIADASDVADVVEILLEPIRSILPLPMPRPRPLPITGPFPLPEPLPLPQPLDLCDLECTMEYTPLCSLPSNGCGEYKTYSNNCALNVYNCNNPTHKYYVYTNEACDSIGKSVLPA